MASGEKVSDLHREEKSGEKVRAGKIERLQRIEISRRGWLNVWWTVAGGTAASRFAGITGITSVAVVSQSSPIIAAPKREKRDQQSSKASRTQISRLAFSGVPYRYAVQRVADALQHSVFLDRRLDPDSPVDLTIERATDGIDIFRQLAGFRGAVAIEWGDLFFLTPQETESRISSARKTMGTELKRAKSNVRAALLRKRRVQWDDYAQPRRLISRWCNEETNSGGDPERLVDIPYDLIASAELPLMTLADRITLMAIQYGIVAGITENGERISLRKEGV